MICGLSVVVAVLAALFGLAAPLRLQTGHSLPWALLFVPVWIADPLIFLALALLRSTAASELPATATRLLPSFAMLVLFQILLCLRLEHTEPDARTPGRLSWLAVFSPLLIERGVAIAALPRALLAHARSPRSLGELALVTR